MGRYKEATKTVRRLVGQSLRAASLITVLACGPAAETRTRETASASAGLEASAPEASPLWTAPPTPRTTASAGPSEETAAAQPTLRSAIEYGLPYMGDDSIGLKNRDPSLGWHLLQAWGRLHLSWKLVERPADLTTDEIYRERGQYRGTRVCVRGTVTTPGQPTWPTEVRIVADKMPDARVLLVYHEAPIKPDAPARACGVFVGTFMYGVVMVGMLDTPQSRSYLPSAPLPGDMDGARPSAPAIKEGVVPL
jgi:hypothetical protein